MHARIARIGPGLAPAVDDLALADPQDRARRGVGPEDVPVGCGDEHAVEVVAVDRLEVGRADRSRPGHDLGDRQGCSLGERLEEPQIGRRVRLARIRADRPQRAHQLPGGDERCDHDRPDRVVLDEGEELLRGRLGDGLRREVVEEDGATISGDGPGEAFADPRLVGGQRDPHGPADGRIRVHDGLGLQRLTVGADEREHAPVTEEVHHTVRDDPQQRRDVVVARHELRPELVEIHRTAAPLLVPHRVIRPGCDSAAKSPRTHAGWAVQRQAVPTGQILPMTLCPGTDGDSP